MVRGSFLTQLAQLAAVAAVRLPTRTPPAVVRPSCLATRPPAEVGATPALAAAEERATAWALGAATAMMVALPAGAADVAWVGPTKAVLSPLFAVYTLLFLFRTVLSWFPKCAAHSSPAGCGRRGRRPSHSLRLARRYNLNAFPYNVAAWPTEPLLRATRRLIPPVAGVDITPIVWVAVISFFSEARSLALSNRRPSLSRHPLREVPTPTTARARRHLASSPTRLAACADPARAAGPPHDCAKEGRLLTLTHVAVAHSHHASSPGLGAFLWLPHSVQTREFCDEQACDVRPD